MPKEASKGRETAKVQRDEDGLPAVPAPEERPPLATKMHHVAQQPEDSCPSCGAEWHAPQIMTVSFPDGAERHCTDCNLAWRIA